MVEHIKKALYFPIASYFKFFASIRLKKWNPRIIVITGSSGKTTTLHLLESQLKDNVRYSHHANSAYGIPFDILGISRKTLRFSEWFGIILKAPINAFEKPYEENIYIVEADADRPDEGKFLADLLKPEVTIWLSSARTHSMNFDRLIQNKRFKNVDDAIAYEFGHFIENTSKLSLVNQDNELIEKQLPRTNSRIEKINKKDVKKYSISKDGTEFVIKDTIYKFSYLLPEEVGYSLVAILSLLSYLNIAVDKSFKEFYLPPGRSSIFYGIKDTILIDSSYNANLSSMIAVLHMFDQIKTKEKWIVVGDMPEQGNVEKEEHEKLAKEIISVNPRGVILKGKLVSQYTYPLLDNKKMLVESFLDLKGVYEYLNSHIQGGEIILFKGGQSMMLEGIIEKLLKNKSDERLLSRREKIWKERRAKQGV